MGWMERAFEAFLWKSRFIVLTAVVASLVSAFILFFMATADVFAWVAKTVKYATGQDTSSEPDAYEMFHNDVVTHVIGAEGK